MTVASTPVTAGGPLGSPVGDRIAQFVVAERVRFDPFVVRQTVTDDDVHHRQHHGDVGSREGLDELVATFDVDGLGGERADRVDHHDARAVGASLLDRRPEMPVGELGVGAPQQEQLGVFEFERIHRPAAAVGHPQPGADRRPADVALDPRGAHVPEEPAAETHHRQQALVAGVGERQHRFGAMGVDHRRAGGRRSR